MPRCGRPGSGRRRRGGDVPRRGAHILVNAAASAGFDWIETLTYVDWRRRSHSGPAGHPPVACRGSLENMATDALTSRLSAVRSCCPPRLPLIRRCGYRNRQALRDGNEEHAAIQGFRFVRHHDRLGCGRCMPSSSVAAADPNTVLSPVVTTVDGQLQGGGDGQIEWFKGIPFAARPIGNLG